MNATTRSVAFLLVFSTVLTSCGGASLGSIVQGPTPVPGAGDTPVPTAELRFRLHPPEGTSQGADLALEVVDTVTGVGYNSRQLMMTRLEDGTWQAVTTLPLGTLLRYRYLQRGADNDYEETAFGERVRYRLAHVSGTIEIEDTAAAWTSGQYEGARGRILGRVLDAQTGQPVSGMIVTAGGRSTTTEGGGKFRLEGLPPGLHNLVAYHPRGAYRTAQQGAILAADSTTPAEFTVQPAAPVTLTFQVAVPPETPSDQPVRLAGNLLQLGNVFSPLAGGLEVSPARAVEMVWVDETHRLALVGLYAGTDLRYKYSLGGGFWSAERDDGGGFVTRQLIVPETDTIVSDKVTAWSGGSEPVRFQVAPPEGTAAGEEIGLQLNPFTPFEPLPMTQSEDDRWVLELHGAAEMTSVLTYRYCRDLECGRADEIGEAGTVGGERSLDMAAAGLVEDSIDEWAYWRSEAASPELPAVDVISRPGFEVGVEMAPIYRPSWTRYEQRSMARIAELGANSVTLTPTWILAGTRSTPMIEFDPSSARFESELSAAAAAAREQGLQVNLRPGLAVPRGWWSAGLRNGTWWDVFFGELESYLLSQATLAQSIEADKLVLTGGQLLPSLPGGGMPDGQLTHLPADADGRWRAILEKVRGSYDGPLAFEVELADDLAAAPTFIDLFDEIHVYWHAPLTTDPAADVPELQAEAERYLELELLAALPADLPLVISAEYLSLDGSASACPAAPEGGCRSPAEFDAGEQVEEGPEIDLAAQAQAIHAVLQATTVSERVEGFYVRRFNPMAALLDGSASVYGKPAADVLSYWYPRIRGEQQAP